MTSRERIDAAAPEVHRLGFVDADCWAGPFRTPLPARLHGGALGGLVETMSRLGIAEACPAGADALVRPARDGNLRLAADTAGRSELHPVWVIAAHHTAEAAGPEAVVKEMRSAQVRMARAVFGPADGYFGPLHVLQLERLLDLLAADRVPLMVDLCDQREIASRELSDLLRAWPDLPVILTFPKMEKEERVLYCLLERHRNLRVCCSGYQVLGGIEEMIRLFGSAVPLFGSNYPLFTPLQSMLQVIYGEISDADRERVAGGNMRDLLRGAWSSKP